jgi:predicted nucleic acid-binding protein
MKLVCVDACCVINLIKGDAIDIVSSLQSIKLGMQGLVEDEIGESFDHIISLADKGRVSLLSGDQILASEVGAVASRYGIGLGESECIVIGKKLNCRIASDDKKARTAAHTELGKDRVTGSVGLLKLAVADGLLTERRAFELYEKMVSGGGFLPRLRVADFGEAQAARHSDDHQSRA